MLIYLQCLTHNSYSIEKNVTSLKTLRVKLLQMVLENSKLGSFLWVVHLEEGSANVVLRLQCMVMGFLHFG